jgi:hypothetical protein
LSGDVEVDVVGVEVDGMDNDLKVHLSSTIPVSLFAPLPPELALPGRSSLPISSTPLSSPSSLLSDPFRLVR